ncbi:uncharacterized protein Tco025E_04904, partial [Trypanosoma conorhini]
MQTLRVRHPLLCTSTHMAALKCLMVRCFYLGGCGFHRSVEVVGCMRGLLRCRGLEFCEGLLMGVVDRSVEVVGCMRGPPRLGGLEFCQRLLMGVVDRSVEVVGCM